MSYEEIRAQRLKELDELCAKHPKQIPVKEVAAYLGIKPNTFRSAVLSGCFKEFATHWAQKKYVTVGSGANATTVPTQGRNEFLIATERFYSYITNNELGGAV